MKKAMNKTILVLLCLSILSAVLTACSNEAASDEPDSYTTEQKQEDAAYLWDMMQENFAYQTTDSDFVLNRKEYNRDNFIKKVGKTKSDREFYISLTSFVNEFNSPHTYMRLKIQYDVLYDPTISEERYNQKQNEWYNILYDENFSFPVTGATDMSVTADDESLLVYSSVIDGIEIGDVVTSVNKEPAKKFINEIEDGRKMPNKIEFAVTNPLTAKSKTVVYSLSENDESDSTSKSKTTVMTDSFFKEEVLDEKENIGFLRLGHMSDKETKPVIEGLFKSGLNYKGIIIDVRNNGGGTDTAYRELISQLYPLKEGVSKTVVGCDEYVAPIAGGAQSQSMESRGYFKTNFPLAVKERIKNFNVDIFKMPHTIVSENKNNDMPYTGKIIVLQNGNSFSASCSFVDEMKCTKLATSLGTPMFGGRAITPIFPILPNSAIPFCISSSMYITADGKIDEIDGIPPDVYVEDATPMEKGAFMKTHPNEAFWGSEADKQYQTAKELIKNEK